MSSEEWLVVLDPEDAWGLQQARTHARVTQVASPRLVIVEAEPSTVSALAALPGVEGVYEGPVPDEVLDSLAGPDALFVRAWQVRQSQPRDERRGERLNWDAEGFEPP